MDILMISYPLNERSKICAAIDALKLDDKHYLKEKSQPVIFIAIGENEDVKKLTTRITESIAEKGAIDSYYIGITKGIAVRNGNTVFWTWIHEAMSIFSSGDDDE